ARPTVLGARPLPAHGLTAAVNSRVWDEPMVGTSSASSATDELPAALLFCVGTDLAEAHVDRYYREHYKRMLKFLPRFQKMLVGDPTIARDDARLAPTALMTAGTASA